jgi:hypothetical protein
MHRSGTSAITRLVSMLGVSLPRRLMGAAPGNEAGHWEPWRLVKYHEQVLAELGSSWNDWDRLDLKQLSAARRDQISADICEIVEEDFGPAPLFVVKDPRISRFAPFFVDALGTANISVLPLVVFRNPLDVIESLIVREEFWPDSLDRTDATFLWLSQLLTAEKAARDGPHAFLSYEAVMADPVAAMQRTVEDLGIETPISASEAAPDMAAFIDESHRHHAHRPDEVLLDPQLAGWVGDSYAAFRDLEAHRNVTGARETLDRVGREFNSALPLLATSATARRKALAAAQAEIGDLRREIEEARVQLRMRNETAEQVNRTLAATEARNAELEAALSNSTQQFEQARQSNEAALRQVDAIRWEFQNSTSWKLTAPVRQTRKGATEVFRFLERLFRAFS